ncbi:hypothetical protein [Paeniglutamicibacter kerguelensis]|uniref:Membrane protein implicated in regulation of membrane protease activity n=1 Tax=Paeniglutamicibacter kerguelensis TaxID=254788 RepID=A0ABS4XK94_9MICC|nr:hypothetical protein [Paeniglutamicibacter kerguelensis]MBP2388751.1 membrane protein implicated in regulation of membrane protease activity [Paeniglutamicibacter kerguelensis]
MKTGERRLTPVARVAAPTPLRYFLAFSAAVVGLAIPLLAGSLPVLVVLFSAIVLLLSLISGARQDPYKRMMTYPLVIGLSLVLLINFGTITWTITALVGFAVLGMILGRARRAARQGPEVLPEPKTDPMAVPATTVATWAIGKDRFEELGPSGEKIDELLGRLDGQFSALTLRRGAARMDAVGIAPDAVEVYETDDLESPAWNTLVASGRTMLGNEMSAAGSPDQTDGESLRRARAAARHFAMTGSRSRDLAWSASHRDG